jgi:hypothetical protein
MPAWLQRQVETPEQTLAKLGVESDATLAV